MSERGRPERPRFEIQIHSGDIRSGVKYLFFDRRRLLRWGSVVAAWALFLVFGLLAAPRAILDATAGRAYRAEIERRARLGERLESLTEEMADLASQAEALRLTMGRIHLAYGLSGGGEAESLGGYPVPAEPVPETIYAATIEHANRVAAEVEQELSVLDAFITGVQEFERAHAEQVDETPSLSPLIGEFVLTSPFGRRRSPFTKEIHFHSGLDLAAARGTQVYAPADGTVVYAGRYPLRLSVAWWRFGNLVALRHGERFITLFGHCDEIRVANGEKVEQGEVIATVGNTGWSTSPHLHYEVRVLEEDGTFAPVDPRIYILDHRWADEERLLVRARAAPDTAEFEPLPRLIGD